MPPCGRLSGTQAGADVCGGIGAIDVGGLSTPSGPVVAAIGVGVCADVLDGAGAGAALLDVGAVAGVVEVAALGLAAAVVVVSVGLGVPLEVTGTAAGANRTAAVVVGLEVGDG